MHGYTGAINIVPMKLADELQAWNAQNRSSIDSFLSPELTGTFLKGGILTELSLEEEIGFVGDLSRKLAQGGTTTRTKFFFIPSYNCQLRCPYCFEREIQDVGTEERWLSKIMSAEVADAAFEMIGDLQKSPTRNPLTLYGGEPFTPANLKIVPHILKRGNELGYRFVAITNCVNLDLYRQWLRPEIIEGLLVTVDGPARTHDKNRIYASGKGTFDRVISNIRLALDCGLKIRVRINTNWEVLGALQEFAEIIEKEGWHENPDVAVYCQAMWEPDSGMIGLDEIGVIGSTEVQHAFGNGSAPERLSSIKLDNIVRYLNQTGLNEVISSSETIKYKLDMLLRSNPFAALDPTNCGAQKGMYLFDPFGGIYVCTEHVGMPEERIGTFWPNKRFFNDKLNRWHDRTIHNLPACQRCRYALLCGGGCAYHAQVEMGDMYHSFCDGFDQQFQVLVQEAAAGHGTTIGQAVQLADSCA